SMHGHNYADALSGTASAQVLIDMPFPAAFLKRWTKQTGNGYTKGRYQPGDERAFMIACRYKVAQGRRFCASDCPAHPETPSGGVFHYARVEHPGELPPADERIVDVAVLDLNCGWPNLGHDSLVHAVLETACDLLPQLVETGLALRAISFAVRDH